MKVRYKGQKEKITIALPIGMKSKAGIRSLAVFTKQSPERELADIDAKALVKADPINFEMSEVKEVRQYRRDKD